MATPHFEDGRILYASHLNMVTAEVDANGNRLDIVEADKVDKTTTVNGHPLSDDVTVSKADVGLGNVDNTSDADKPVSSATQTALDGKANSYHTHFASAITGGVFPAARLPSASTAASGIVRLATPAETLIGFNTTIGVTPSGVKAVVDTLGVWEDYEPTAFAGITDITDSLSVVEARYSVIGKTVNVILSLNVTTAITTGGTLNFSLPVVPRAVPTGTWNRVLGASTRHKGGVTAPLNASAATYSGLDSLNVSFLENLSTAGSTGWEVGGYFRFNLTYEAA